MNINTKEYWEKRFTAGDWEAKKGRIQTSFFAKEIIRYVKLPSRFSGNILDFGCGLGDALPIYRKKHRYAKLTGVDITEAAIKKCNQKYRDIAQFIQCDYTQIPYADVIISCAVFEHLSNQTEVARHLLTKCKDLYIVVPYKENIVHSTEHINSYDKKSFDEFNKHDYKVYLSKGWSGYGLQLWFNLYFKNILRPFFNKKIVHRKKMIIFHLIGIGLRD